MAEDKTIIMPDNQNNGWGNIPFAMTLPLLGGYGNGYGGFGNGLFGGSGFGAFLGGLFGSVLPGFFNGGFGNWGGGNNGAAAASLGAQATANNNTETILRAIDGTDADVRLVATTLNSDVNTVKTNLATLQNGLTALTGQTGLSAAQIINAIQAGDASLASQLCQCCCQTQQAILTQGYEGRIQNMQQTETLMGGNQRIVDAIADLKATTIDQFCQAEKRDMQNEINRQGDIITQLRNEADNARQTAQFGAMLAPIAQEVNDIKCKLPSTATVQYPNLVAFSTTPNIGGFYGGWGNGFNGFGYGFPGGSYWG